MLRTFCLREASLTAKAVCMVLIAAFVVTGCASSTLIRSVPPGAKVYVDGQYLGQSPVTHRDSAPLWTTKTVTLKLDGYGDQSGTIRKENLRVGPLIGCILVYVPCLWLTGYPDQYTFTLDQNGAAVRGHR